MTRDQPAMTPLERRAMSDELRMICMRISRRTRFENVESVAPHQFSVLCKLQGQPLTIGALADAECVSRPSMTRTVDALAADGYLVRVADDHDRRRTWVHLTEKGREVVTQTKRSRDVWMNERIAQLSDEECAVLARASEILGRVVAR